LIYGELSTLELASLFKQVATLGPVQGYPVESLANVASKH